MSPAAAARCVSCGKPKASRRYARCITCSNAERYESTRTETFLSRVNPDGPVPVHLPELGPCWVWTGATNPKGYGRFQWNKRQSQAPRVAWEIAYGPVPDGLWVLHRCDNPACCRPNHLFLGTAAENSADMMAKGRRRGSTPRPRPGELNHQAKLTEPQVIRIRRDRAGGRLLREVASEHGVSVSLVSMIVRGERWGHLQ